MEDKAVMGGSSGERKGSRDKGGDFEELTKSKCSGGVVLWKPSTVDSSQNLYTYEGNLTEIAK